MQTYYSGEPVRIGDVVSWPTERGKIVALQEDLSTWGIEPAEADGRVMIEFERTGMVCEEPATAEDLAFICRAQS
jgi:hypothetical protein